MAQFIRTPFDMDFENINQICQVSYHNERVIELFWDVDTHRVVVQDNGQYFWLTSPDIDNLTIYQVLTYLCQPNDQFVVTWASGIFPDEVLNSIVEQASLSQITVYAPNQPIPNVHFAGPLPVIAGQPLPAPNAPPNAPDVPDAPNEPDFGLFQNAPPNDDNNNDNDDNQSTLSDMPNYRIIDRFDDSDDDRRYR
jgi:hypothetical protein